MPEVVGLIDAEQLAVVELTVVKLHGVPVNEPDAVPVLVNATVPPGVVAPAPALSFTKAVQLIDWATTAVVGEQVTIVIVALPPTETVLLVPELFACAVSAADAV